MIGHHFTKFDPNKEGKTKFEQLLDVFMQLLTYTNGDVSEALDWMNQLDKEYDLTNNEYGMGDFIDELKEKGYIQENQINGEIKITSKTEQGIRKKIAGRNIRETEENKNRRSPYVQTRWR